MLQTLWPSPQFGEDEELKINAAAAAEYAELVNAPDALLPFRRPQQRVLQTHLEELCLGRQASSTGAAATTQTSDGALVGNAVSGQRTAGGRVHRAADLPVRSRVQYHPRPKALLHIRSFQDRRPPPAHRVQGAQDASRQERSDARVRMHRRLPPLLAVVEWRWSLVCLRLR